MSPRAFRCLLWSFAVWLLAEASPLPVVAQGEANAPLILRLWGSDGRIPRKDDISPFARANRAVLEAFAAAHPNVRLEIVSGIEVQGPANESGLLMAFAGGIGPDVVYVNFRQLENYIHQGFLYPLDEFLAQDPQILDRVHPRIRDVIRVDGHLYSLPYQQWVQALYYRKDLFREAGLDPEKPPRDWNEFYQDAQKLTIPEKGQYGFIFSNEPQSTSYWWINFLWQAGGEIVAKDANGRWTCAFDTPAGATALEFYRKLTTDEWTRPTDGKRIRGVAVRKADIAKDIQQGRVGMWFQYQSDSITNTYTSNVSPSLIGIAPMPRGPTGIQANELNASMWGISALEKDPRVRQMAWEFIKFMGSEDADRIRTKSYVEAGLGMYLSPVSLQKWGYGEYVNQMSRAWVQSIQTLFEHGKPEPYGQNCQMIYSELDHPLEEINLYPNRDPADILHRAKAKIDAKLLGYVAPSEMAHRRRVVATALVVLCGVIFTAVLLSLRKLARSAAESDAGTGGTIAGRRGWRWQIAPWLFMLPALLSIVVWAYWPLLRGMVMAFQDYKVVGQSRFIGLDNFVEAAYQETFWKGIMNSFLYVGMNLGLGFFLPVFLAILLTEIPRGTVVFRTLYYLPAVTSGLVVVFLWKEFYDPSEHGLFNQLLTQAASAYGHVAALLHLPASWRPADGVKINWLGDPKWAMLAVVLPAVWAGAGPGSLIYQAAMKTIPDELYEAADLDGAGLWTKIRSVTLPTLMPLLVINFVGAFIGAFKAMENIFVMTGGGPLNSTHTIGLEVWYNAFMYLKFGYATAAAWIMGAMLIGFTLYQLRILRNVRFQSAASGT